MVELGLPELTTEQFEVLCSTAENAARKHILSKVSAKMIERLDISVEAEGEKPVNLTIEVNLVLSPIAKDVDPETLVSEAVKEAHKASENYLSKTK